jgi:predicted transcriptional regulator
MTEQTPGELQEPAKRKALNCFISGEVKDRLDRYAESSGRAIWHVTNEALDKYLKTQGA